MAALSRTARALYHDLVKRILLAHPRGYCAGVERAIDTVERALRSVRVAGVRAPGDRPQPARRRRPGGEGRGVRRGRATTCRRRAGGVLRPRRRAGGARQRGSAETVGDRRDVPAGHQGAPGGAAVRPPRPHDPADRPRGPRRGDRHRRARARTHHPGADGGGGGDGRRSRIPNASRTSARRRCRWTTPRRSSTSSGAGSPRCRRRPRDDICYATQNRQEAVKAVAARADVVLVIGSANSSNSNRLVEVARSTGDAAQLDRGRARHRPDLAPRRADDRRHGRRLGAGAHSSSA